MADEKKYEEIEDAEYDEIDAKEWLATGRQLAKQNAKKIVGAVVIAAGAVAAVAGGIAYANNQKKDRHKHNANVIDVEPVSVESLGEGNGLWTDGIETEEAVASPQE